MLQKGRLHTPMITMRNPGAGSSIVQARAVSGFKCIQMQINGNENWFLGSTLARKPSFGRGRWCQESAIKSAVC